MGQLWKSLSGVTVLATVLVLGTPAPAASGGAEGCVGDVVVDFDVPVWSRPGHDTWPFVLPTPLPPGEWSVQVSSVDSYEGRASTSQPQEQWLLELVDHVTLGPTSDLAEAAQCGKTLVWVGTWFELR